jgi:hypothetical protein
MNYPGDTPNGNAGGRRVSESIREEQDDASVNREDRDAVERRRLVTRPGNLNAPTGLREEGNVDNGGFREMYTDGVMEKSWTGDVKEFVLNGFYRETKVFFNTQQMEFGSMTYKRFKLHFDKGKMKQEERYNLDMYDQNKVKQWWKNHGVQTLHKKMMEKKSNAMADLKRHMKGKSVYICN